jgi:SAM-dependent methyltransferase
VSGRSWDAAAARSLARPYLDPLVGEAKRQAHLRLVREWAGDLAHRTLLKTDLWEEGVAGDELLLTLAAGAGQARGVDISRRVVAAAARRAGGVAVELEVGSVLQLPLEDRSVDVVVSTSTLDHLADRDDIVSALHELRRVLRPGGVLVVTLDNRQNIGDPLLRLAHRAGAVPFPLGPSVSVEELEELVEAAGLRASARAFLVHGPRLVSTVAVRTARLLPGRAGERAVRTLLACFDAVGRRWPRRLAAFVAVRAERQM